MAAFIEIFVFLTLGLISAGCLTVGGAMAWGEARLSRRLSDLSGAEPQAAASGRPWAFGERLTFAGRDREEIQADLFAAGYYHPDALAVFGVLRLALALAAGLGMAVLLAVGGNWEGGMRFLAVAATGGTFIMAKPLLRSRARNRARRINAEMPFTLDILLMMLESGVSLDQCFRAFAQNEGAAAPTVRATVVALVDDLQRGMSYDAALARWSDRLGVTGARELASVFRQSLAHGSELGATVRQFSAEFSETRVANAREAIGGKSASMTIAMMIFLMPALFIILAGPAVSTLSKTMTQFRNGGAAEPAASSQPAKR